MHAVAASRDGGDARLRCRTQAQGHGARLTFGSVATMAHCSAAHRVQGPARPVPRSCGLRSGHGQHRLAGDAGARRGAAADSLHVLPPSPQHLPHPVLQRRTAPRSRRAPSPFLTQRRFTISDAALLHQLQDSVPFLHTNVPNAVLMRVLLFLVSSGSRRMLNPLLSAFPATNSSLTSTFLSASGDFLFPAVGSACRLLL